MSIIKVAIVDDHQMISKALEKMITANEKFEVIMTAHNGEDFLEAVSIASVFPDVVLMDVNMPLKNGIETTEEFMDIYPQGKVIGLTMDDSEKTIIKMLKAGAKAYLLKDMTSEDLFRAIETVQNNGIFYSDLISSKVKKINIEKEKAELIKKSLKPNELVFLEHACSELTYSEIADKMFLSPKTIDGYRDSVFIKLDVKNRVGMVLFALKNELC